MLFNSPVFLFLFLPGTVAAYIARAGEMPQRDVGSHRSGQKEKQENWRIKQHFSILAHPTKAAEMNILELSYAIMLFPLCQCARTTALSAFITSQCRICPRSGWSRP